MSGESFLHAKLERRVYAPTGKWIGGNAGKRRCKRRGKEWKGDTQGFECTLKG